MSKYRVLIFATNAPESGVTSVIRNLFGALNSDEFIFDIISFSTNEKLKEVAKNFNGDFFPLDMFYLRHPKKFNEILRSIFGRCHYDTVAYNVSYLYTSSLYNIAKKYEVGSIVYYSHSSKIETNSSIKRRILEAIHNKNRNKLKNADIVRVACSQKAGEWLYGTEVPFIMIKNGISTEGFSFSEDYRNEIRNELNLNNKKVIGNVGRLSYQKNQEFLIKAFALTHKLEPNSELIILGEGPDRDKLSELIKKLELEDSCRLLGNRNDINKIYSALDLFVLPSRFEGLPVSAIEAQDNGLPCLLADTISEDTRINDNVIFCPIESPERWGEEMSNYLKCGRQDNASNKLSNEGWDIKSASQALRTILISDEEEL